MSTERIKSFILFSLVIMSFVLTTRIWFNVSIESIEGLFVMSPKDKLSQGFAASYDKESLLKPGKVVVHMGTNHTLLFNNQNDKVNYDNILRDSNNILKDLLDNDGNYIEANIGIDELQRIREGRAVELIYNPSTELDYIKSLLDVDKDLWNDVKDINSIVISPSENKIYIVDQSKAVIHQFTAFSMSTALADAIDRINDKENLAVFLSDLNQANSQLYGKYAIAPVSVTSMPVLSVKKELEADTKPSPEIAAFFDDGSKIISIPDADGTISFTDREERTLKLGTDGALEYYKYNINSGDIEHADMKTAIEIAVDYVKNHLGFNGDFYLSGIESRLMGGRTAYIISFNYKYNGIPIMTETDTSKSAIEVEIVGGEVQRYKRNVREVVSETRTVNIKTFNEVLDIVQGSLDKYLSVNKSESIAKINDLYLAYVEWDESLIPYWVVDVEVESSVSGIKITNNKKYFIKAEDGSVLGEQ